jgi:hypothetical protein
MNPYPILRSQNSKSALQPNSYSAPKDERLSFLSPEPSHIGVPHPLPTFFSLSIKLTSEIDE